MIDKNSPAYPFTWKDVRGEHVEPGLRLRQYYAAKAIQGMLASETEHYFSTVVQVVKRAFEMADAMIEFENNELKEKE